MRKPITSDKVVLMSYGTDRFIRSNMVEIKMGVRESLANSMAGQLVLRARRALSRRPAEPNIK